MATGKALRAASVRLGIMVQTVSSSALEERAIRVGVMVYVLKVLAALGRAAAFLMTSTVGGEGARAWDASLASMATTA